MFVYVFSTQGQPLHISEKKQERLQRFFGIQQ
jgi:hypothetical protein